MGYYKHQPVVLVPADKLKQFNDIMQRQGYGPENMTCPVVSASATTKEAVVTHYALECVADDGMLAAIKLALKAIDAPEAKVEVFSKPPTKIDAVAVSKVDEVLTKMSLSTKTKIDAKIDNPIQEESIRGN